MDKVKLYLMMLKKHHFWVLCGIVTLCGLVSWWLGSASVRAEATANQVTAKGAYDKVNGIKDPVNDKFKTAVETAHAELKKQAFDVWRKQFANQQKLLRWPEHLGQKEFIDVVGRLRPDEQIPDEQRRRYRNLIFPKAWEQLHAKVDMRRPVFKPGVIPPAPGPNGQIETVSLDPTSYDLVGVVEWQPENRAQLVERYYFNPSPTPSDVKVRLTQEDLWVLQDMAEVIAVTNNTVAERLKVALDSGNAAVKKIESLDVAQWAIDAAQHDEPIVWAPSAQAGMGGMGGMGSMGGGLGGGSGGGMMGGGLGGGAMGGDPAGGPPSQAGLEAAMNDLLLAGRYLDDAGQPMAAETVKPGGTLPYAELKHLFVRMRLVADQRRVPDLLTACTNAQLPIEVRRLRIQVISEGIDATPGAPVGGGGMGMGAMGGGMGGGRFGGGGMGGGRFGEGGMGGAGKMGGGEFGGRPGPAAPMAAGPATDGTVGPGPFDVNLEICGVITLYNPPVLDNLGKGSAADPGKKVAGIPTTPVVLPSGSQSGGGMSGGMGGMGGMMGSDGKMGGRFGRE